MRWMTLATTLVLLTDLYFIWTVSVVDGHWLVKRRILLGRDRPRNHYAS